MFFFCAVGMWCSLVLFNMIVCVCLLWCVLCVCVAAVVVRFLCLVSVGRTCFGVGLVCGLCCADSVRFMLCFCVFCLCCRVLVSIGVLCSAAVWCVVVLVCVAVMCCCVVLLLLHVCVVWFVVGVVLRCVALCFLVLY